MLYYFIPVEFNYSYCLTANLLFLVQTTLYFLISRRPVVSFEFFFLFSFYFVNLVYPVTYYPENPTFSVFGYPFNYDVINKSTMIAYISFTSFMLGLSLLKSKWLTVDKKPDLQINTIYESKLFILFILLTVIYIGNAGVGFFKGYDWFVEQMNSNDVSPVTTYLNYSAALVAMFAFIGSKKKVIKYLTGTIVFIAIFLISGSRTLPVALILILFANVNDVVRKIPTLPFLVLLISGILIMSIIANTRTNDISISEFLTEGSNTESVLDFASDLTVNNRNLYVLVDYVDNHGLLYGLNMLAGVIGVIPGAVNLVSSISGIPTELMTTASFNTMLEFGTGSSWGLGGNMVADVYLSFGLIGNIIGFFLFGLLMSSVISKYKSQVSYYIIYFFLVSMSIYMNRESFLLPLRGILFSLIIFHLLNSKMSLFFDRIKILINGKQTI